MKKFNILARDGYAGDFVSIQLEGRTISAVLAKLRRFGSLNGFGNLIVWNMEEA